jgi:UDP-glucose 4-epimerase
MLRGIRMSVLITGGAGFIGSHLAAACRDLGPVRVLDDLTGGNRQNLDGKDVEFQQGSITDSEAVARAMQGVETVFHLAAFVSVPASMADPLACARLNVQGLLTVLEAAETAGVRRLVFASSAAVYGDDPTVPKRESMVPQPRSPYALTKLDGEFYCEHYARRGRIQTACARFFNVFGPRQRPDSAYAAVVPGFITRALQGVPLVIYGDGEQTRDFIYVGDVVDGLIHLAQRPDLSGAFNVGYGAATTVNYLAGEICRLTGSSSSSQHLPERPGDVRHSVAAVERIRATGWCPRYSLETGLAETVAWYRR